MASLKAHLFSQFATEGFNLLIEDLQGKYKPKKGRRFNHNNITYEVGRPAFKEGVLEFEISSKIPQDELKSNKDMKSYFSDIKKIVNSEKKKPISIEMENIVWDSKKETEKERDYVKLLYQYKLNDLYNEEEVSKRYDAMVNRKSKEKLPEISGIFTNQGKLVLNLVRENVQKIANKHIDSLINANKKVKASL